MRSVWREIGRPLAAVFLVPLAALAMAACGGDDDEEPGARKGNKTEQAFLKAMIPHHESAVQMANVAKQRAQHREIERLAVDIVAAQSNDIMQMERIHKRLFRSEITPDPAAHEQLGLAAKQAGMDHEGASEALGTARPFDRAFIDEMVPHHQGAIRMARVLEGKTKDPEMKRLAEAIIRTQSSEIRTMNAWRRKWFGAPSPAGGVPEPGEVALPGEHDGH
jgi:uncharacterized protein (DUF305 family)